MWSRVDHLNTFGWFATDHTKLDIKPLFCLENEECRLVVLPLTLCGFVFGGNVLVTSPIINPAHVDPVDDSDGVVHGTIVPVCVGKFVEGKFRYAFEEGVDTSVKTYAEIPQRQMWKLCGGGTLYDHTLLSVDPISEEGQPEME